MRDSSNENDIETLKRIKEDFFALRIYDLPRLALEVVLAHIRAKIGDPTRCIGVFGPYENRGEIILHTVARKIAARGYTAIMYNGYYIAGDPNHFYEITQIVPDIVPAILKRIRMEHLYSYKILPGIVSKATFNMIPQRTQYRELQGCYERGIPLLGYIVAEKIMQGSNDCPFLVPEAFENQIASAECTAPDPESCPGRAPHRPSCPFYDIYNIPWEDKQFYLSDRRNILIALRDIDCIDPYLSRFLRRSTSAEI